MKAKDKEREEAIARLREWIKPGDTVYTILDSVSKSGMSRQIRVVLMNCDKSTGEVVTLHPNYAVGKALGLRHGKRNGRELDSLAVQGCGMDMGFWLVYNLSRVLWPDGFGCIGEKCRSNDHSNGERDRTPHGCIDERHRNPSQRDPACTEACGLSATACDHWHTDGGYALNHRWL